MHACKITNECKYRKNIPNFPFQLMGFVRSGQFGGCELLTIKLKK